MFTDHQMNEQASKQKVSPFQKKNQGLEGSAQGCITALSASQGSCQNRHQMEWPESNTFQTVPLRKRPRAKTPRSVCWVHCFTKSFVSSKFQNTMAQEVAGPGHCEHAPQLTQIRKLCLEAFPIHSSKQPYTVGMTPRSG